MLHQQALKDPVAKVMKKLEKLPNNQTSKPEPVKAINDASKKLGPDDPSDVDDLAKKILNGNETIPRDKVR